MTQPTNTHDAQARERSDLLSTLDRHRGFLRHTVQGLTDEQAASRPTVSALSLSGLIHHVAETEHQWLQFVQLGPAAMAPPAAAGDATPEQMQEWWDSRFRLAEGQTLADALVQYEAVAAETARVVEGLPDLDADHPLPEAPWFEPGARWSARRVLLHMIAETSQHAGHADILRESIDGQKTMG